MAYMGMDNEQLEEKINNINETMTAARHPQATLTVNDIHNLFEEFSKLKAEQTSDINADLGADILTKSFENAGLTNKINNHTNQSIFLKLQKPYVESITNIARKLADGPYKDGLKKLETNYKVIKISRKFGVTDSEQLSSNLIKMIIDTQPAEGLKNDKFFQSIARHAMQDNRITTNEWKEKIEKLLNPQNSLEKMLVNPGARIYVSRMAHKGMKLIGSSTCRPSWLDSMKQEDNKTPKKR